MMFYIDQLYNPSFPIGLVKTESVEINVGGSCD